MGLSMCRRGEVEVEGKEGGEEGVQFLLCSVRRKGCMSRSGGWRRGVEVGAADAVHRGELAFGSN